jgi:hypothetical protein
MQKQLNIYLNEVTVEIVKSELESNGITFDIQKDDCGGMYPGMAVGSTMRVYVDEKDFEKAQKIVAVLEKELKEQKFEEIEHMELPEIDAQEGMMKNEKKVTEKNGFSYFWFGLLLGCVVSFFCVWFFTDLNQKNVNPITNGIQPVDYDQDGFNETNMIFKKGLLVEQQIDRNKDGRPDRFVYFINNVLNSEKYDDNFDGEIDGIVNHKDISRYTSKADLDYDGDFESFAEGKNGMLQEVIYKKNGAVYKKILYSHGSINEEFIDHDQDGVFDEKRTYDFYNEIVKKTESERILPSDLNAIEN